MCGFAAFRLSRCSKLSVIPRFTNHTKLRSTARAPSARSSHTYAIKRRTAENSGSCVYYKVSCCARKEMVYVRYERCCVQDICYATFKNCFVSSYHRVSCCALQWQPFGMHFGQNSSLETAWRKINEFMAEKRSTCPPLQRKVTSVFRWFLTCCDQTGSISLSDLRDSRKLWAPMASRQRRHLGTFGRRV